MNPYRKPLALMAAVAMAVPALALASGEPSSLPTPAQAAYGVICDRPPYDTSANVNHGKCVKAYAEGVRGDETASDAARTACRHLLPGEDFGACVSSTKPLVQGLSALHRH